MNNKSNMDSKFNIIKNIIDAEPVVFGAVPTSSTLVKFAFTSQASKIGKGEDGQLVFAALEDGTGVITVGDQIVSSKITDIQWTDSDASTGVKTVTVSYVSVGADGTDSSIITNTFEIIDYSGVESLISDLNVAELKAAIDTLNGVGEGSVAHTVAAALDGLDVVEISETGKPIISISETDGKVSASTGTITAENVTYQPATTEGGETPAAVTVQDEIDTLVEQIETNATAGKVVVYSGDTSTDKISADGTDYVIKQGNTTVATINIAKDMVVQSGEVITATGDETKGTGSEESAGLTAGEEYIKLVIANADTTADTIYIAANNLVDVYTGSDGVSVNGYVITGVVDNTSESFLTVGYDGFKLSGVQDAIDIAKSEAIADASSYTDTQIAAEAAAREAAIEELANAVTSLDADDIKYNDTSVSAALSTLETAVAALNGNESTEGSVAKAVADAKTVIDAYTVNGKEISENPTIGGSDIALTGYVALDSSADTTVTATDTVNDAIAKLAKSVADAETAASEAHTEIADKTTGFVTVSLDETTGKKVYTIEESDIASATELANLSTYVGRFTSDTAATVVDYVDETVLTAKTELIGTADDETTADTINGAKNFATDAVSTAKTELIGTDADTSVGDTITAAKVYAKEYADSVVAAAALTWTVLD